MPNLPAFLTDQTEETIRQRMLDTIPADIDKTEGSYIWDSLAPAAIELAMAAIWAQQVLERGFAQTTYGAYLDLRADEHGITRRAAVRAMGQAVFTGTIGVTIPAGTQISTSGGEAAPAIFFITTVAGTIGASGTVAIPIEATVAGSYGNVAAGTLIMFAQPLAGITGVTNLTPTFGGFDIEDDSSLLARLLQRVRTPSTGGNKADYVRWAFEVPGVGGVSVIPIRDGAGTVSVSIINTTKVPAEATLTDTVQNYIAPPWTNTVEAEAMTLGGHGVSIDMTQTDDNGNSIQMLHNVTGAGTITHSNIQIGMRQPGIWQARIRIKVNSLAGTNDLLQIGIWNVSGATWCKTRAGGIIDAVRTIRAFSLWLTFTDLIQEYYWNGQDLLELRIIRLQTDTTTTVWIDQVAYRSTFSKDTGEGKAPIGARVTVEPAIALLINVSATLAIMEGFNISSVMSAAQENIRTYIKSLAFTADNDVRYVRIGQAILDTPGVHDYVNLLVNGGTTNIAVGLQEVAVLGSVNLL